MRSHILRAVRAAMRRAQDGQGLAEYGLILVLIAVSAVAILTILGTTVASLYSRANGVFPGA